MGYGIIVKSFGKAPNNSDKNKELLEKKKELLKKKFKEKSKELSKNNKIIETDIKEDSNNDSIQVNNKTNEQLKLLKNQIKIFKSEKIQLNSKLKKQEKKNMLYNNTNLKLNTIIDSKEAKLLNLKEKYDDMKMQYDILQSNFKELQSEFNNYKKQTGQQNLLKKLHTKVELLSVKNKDLRFQLGTKDKTIETLIRDLDSLRINKLDGYSDLYKQQIESLENDKYSLSVENKNLRKKLELYEPPEPTKKAEENIIIENMKERKSTKPRHVLVEIKESIGLLKRNEDKYIYIDFDDNTFNNVNVSKYYLADLEQIFCMVDFNTEDNEYVVTNVYPFIETKEELIGYLYEMDLRKNKAIKNFRSKSIKKEYTNYESFNNQKVLVINSFNQKYFISELRKYNLKVSGFDTYLENPQKIIPKLTRYDIIICCTGTSRHYINTIVENTKDFRNEDGKVNNKYQFMENVTMSNLLGRINYAIENIK